MALKVKTLPPVSVATPGTRVPLAATPILVYSATIQSIAANTGTHYFGDETVDSTNGIQFAAGEPIEVEVPPGLKGGDQFDLSEIYVDSSVAASFRVVAWIRKSREE